MSDALMVSSSFLPGRGGIESYLAELCDLLAPRLSVLAAAERDGRPLPTDLGYKTHPFPGRFLKPDRRAVTATLGAARADGTDRILFGTPWPLVLMGPRLRKVGLRYAVIVHGAEMLVPSAIPFVRKRLASALAGAELLLPVSNYTAEKMRAFLIKSGETIPPVELLRARVDLERFRPDVPSEDIKAELGIGPQDNVVACFGRLVKRKGVDHLIKALPAINERVPNTVLVVAGTGPEEKKLKALAAKTEQRVIFAGRVPEEKAPAVYAAAHVFALPVTDRWFGLEIEGLGVVLLEAAASGVPCVTGTSGGTPEAVLDGKTGFVIDASREIDLVEKVTELLTDRDKARQMGQEGRAHVEREFSERSLPQHFLTWLDGEGSH